MRPWQKQGGERQEGSLFLSSPCAVIFSEKKTATATYTELMLEYEGSSENL
ncbi:cysteine-rich receptor-like protein kinase 10 [Pyrus ussuriensis x Pyrus communis]|uniref:Cysteine-rich receptor-like protein kinase 10 n=1 Tax=Pyrus ussuriensis x Pyrus communis TaxID=2448454 RepID=A0A5N5GA34_9ROSA|nr:cysteine-rich receptor-like protein kinase 10 [Pyrus ussuriensis x Pyrus communis]